MVVGNLKLIPLSSDGIFPIIPAMKIQKRESKLLLPSALSSLFGTSIAKRQFCNKHLTYVHFETVTKFWSIHSNEWDILKVVKCSINIEASRLGN